MSPAWIDGSPVTLDAAAAEAARLLAASRLPVVAGLGADIAGARAAIALARRLGGAVDHMHSGALLRDLDVMREAGMMVTTPNEARIRGDVLLLVGAGLLDAWPQLQQRLLAAPFLPGAKVADTPLVSSPPGSGRPAPGGASAQRREARGSVAEAVGEGDRVGVKRRVSFTPPRPPSPALRSATAGHPPLPGEGGSKRRIRWLCPGRGEATRQIGNVRAIGRDPGDLPVLLAALRARVAGRPVSDATVAAKMLDALAADLRSARFGVAVWSAAHLDSLTIEMLCGLVDDLNLETRFTGLPLAPDDNAAGVMETCGWTTGHPMRTGFGRAHPEHDPWRFDATRLVESGEADCALWISAYRDAQPTWSRAVPTIALAGPDTPLARTARVHIAVGRPGIDHDAVAHLAVTGALGYATAAKPSGALSVAQAIARIADALPETGARPC
jgi:formylmethanofuran dehydrogenase subunit B